MTFAGPRACAAARDGVFFRRGTGSPAVSDAAVATRRRLPAIFVLSGSASTLTNYTASPLPARRGRRGQVVLRWRTDAPRPFALGNGGPGHFTIASLLVVANALWN